MIGSAFLIAGAPLLGFARVIDLLETIARNTATVSTNTISTTNSADQERARNYIRAYKPALSARRVWETNIRGVEQKFGSEQEAIAHVLSLRQGDTWP